MKNLFYIFIIVFFFSQTVSAQWDLLDKIKDKAKEKVEQKTDEAIDKGMDKAEEEITKDGNDQEENESDKEDAEDSGRQADTKGSAKIPAKAELKSYSRYDFIPGDKVFYYEDFSNVEAGDFPSSWFTNKSGEVITTNNYPGKWFQMKEDGYYCLDKLINFPENFTLEFDVIPGFSDESYHNITGFDLTLCEVNPDETYPSGYVPGKGGVIINLFSPNHHHTVTGYFDGGYGVTGSYEKEKALLRPKEVNHVCIWVQKTRVRIYMHGEKVFDMPKVLNSSLKLNQLRVWLDDHSVPMFSNIRIAEAGADMRSKLITEGKLVTRGILFDINSDKIKPESYGTLKEIAKVLNENSAVKVKIIGHTDSDGSDASNLELSKKRAASVRSSLSSDFGIDASRMQTDGKGESEPSNDNNSPEGKANNRRVEFLKL